MAEFSEVLKQRNRMCDCFSDGFHCNDCPIKNLKGGTCANYIFTNYEEAEALIMDWAREHPIMTNADKFKEVFGCKIHIDRCTGIVCDCTKSCEEGEYLNFWEKEYKEPKE